ncbi:hypothetical protein DITRI_Ditri17bG0120500 [Diplodiscus trichospermus]
MHVQCTQRREEVIHHFIHQHPLALVDEKKDLKVHCEICQKPCSGSLDSSCYGCQECNYFFHTSCMINIPPQFNHFFHPSGPLLLVMTTKNYSYWCNGCDEYYFGAESGLVFFHCGKCEFNLDVKCALLPTVESKGADKIQHYVHEHPLALRESKEFDSEVWCRACGENCSGLCFVCKRCNFFLHRQCAVEFPLETEIHHRFHPPHPLTLSPLPWDPDPDIFPRLACGGRSNRFMLTYHCTKCDVNLHFDCAKPRLEHILFNCFLRCVQCEFNIHPYCFPSTPKTIKHECHLHPLTITESPFEFELTTSEDKYNSDDEFYCDVCATKRFKRESVYYCEKCRFVAEIRCLISKLFPSLIASKCQTTVDSRAIPKNEENSVLETAIVDINN